MGLVAIVAPQQLSGIRLYERELLVVILPSVTLITDGCHTALSQERALGCKYSIGHGASMPENESLTLGSLNRDHPKPSLQTQPPLI